MTDEDRPVASGGSPKHGYDSRPIPGAVLAMFMAALVVALLLGYLFLSKLVDISGEEDCALAHRRDCGASEPSSGR